MTDSERRRHKRIKVYKSVTFRDDQGDHAGELSDISTSGAAVRTTDETVILDIQVDQELVVESLELGSLVGSVVRTFDDGFAVQFDHSDAFEQELYESLAELNKEPADS